MLNQLELKTRKESCACTFLQPSKVTARFLYSNLSRVRQ